MKKYEYQILKIRGEDDDLLKALNKVGKEGWKVIHFLNNPGTRSVLLAREIEKN